MNQVDQPAVIVIPARLSSTRLAEKLLLRETGKSVLQHTYERAIQSKLASRVIIATDHERILEEVDSFDGEAVMTDPGANSGTDRVAQVAEELDEFDIIANVQGDEPELNPEHIDLAISRLRTSRDTVMSTLAAPIRSDSQWYDSACVKVVVGGAGNALYFSRSPIPFVRESTDVGKGEGATGNSGEDRAICVAAGALQHIGLYAYRREFLLTLASLPPSRLEELERLEQLRVLEAGYSIAVDEVDHACGGIDTADDYAAFVARESQNAVQSDLDHRKAG